MTIELTPEEIAELNEYYAGYTLDGKYKKHFSCRRMFKCTGRHVRYTGEDFSIPMSKRVIKLFEVYTPDITTNE